MCSSYVWRKMENDGDLSDVVRVAGGFNGGNSNSSIFDWKFSSSRPTSLSLIGKPIDFSVPGSMALDSTSSWLKTNIETGDCVKNGNVISQKILGEEGKRPCANLFSRVLQMSSGNKMSDLQSNNFPIIISSMEAKSLSFGDDLSKASGIIGCSSPRIPGIKRRKNQAKKVICIPAPAAANNKPSGEVVPSDLWAWRKYGQKPIKGSPYPRGYYRCSSSKGCSARKQVERSRTDPSMLVITYTSEHNHPWPTQRNALAGSTRSQSLKKNSSSNGAQASKASKSVISKEEKQEMMDDNLSVVITGGSVTSDSGKDETKDIDKTVDVDSLSDFSQGFDENHLPSLSELNDSNDFFPDFSEFEQDSIESIFSQGFNGMKSEEERENKNIDPFNIFGW